MEKAVVSARRVARSAVARFRSGHLAVLTVATFAGALTAPAIAAGQSSSHTITVGPVIDCDINSSDSPPPGGGGACDTSVLRIGHYDPSVDGTDFRALLKFNVEAAVPAGAVVRSARLGLNFMNADGPTDSDIGVYPVTRSWTSGVTWTHASATAAWTTPGGDAGSLLDTTCCGQGPVFWWDVTSAVRTWLSSGGDNGLVLASSTAEDMLLPDFVSSEGSASSGRPRLEITYEPRGVGALPDFQFETIPINGGSQLQINRASGNLLVSSQDLLMAEPGLDVDVDRFYNSEDPASGQAGMRLSVGTDVTLTACDTGRCFTGPSGYHVDFAQRPDGSFEPPPDLDASLTRDDDGTFTVTMRGSGLQYHFPNVPAAVPDRVSDQYGNDVTMSYDAATGRLAGIADDDDHAVAVGYGANGLVASLSEPGTGTWTYGYNGQQLTSASDPVLGDTTYGYNAAGLLSSITYGGQTWTIGYDGSDRVTSIVKTHAGSSTPDATWTVSYGAWSSTITLPSGASSTYGYARSGQVYAPDDAAPTIVDPDDFGGPLVVSHGTSGATVHVDAIDAGSGVAAASLTSGDGSTPYATQVGHCEPAPVPAGGTTTVCDPILRADLVVPASALASGLNSVVVKSHDATGNLASRSIQVLVDSVAPRSPSDIELDTFDPTHDVAEFGVDPDDDPDLPDGTPGSGVESAEARFQLPGGSWSPWARVDDFILSVTGVHDGDAVAVEARAIDAAGNVSPVLSKTLTVHEVTDPPDDPGDDGGSSSGTGSGSVTVALAPSHDGEAIPAQEDAWVTLRSDTGERFVQDTDAAGEAQFQQLEPGGYTVTSVGDTSNRDAIPLNESVTVSDGTETRVVALFDPVEVVCNLFADDNAFVGEYCNLNIAEKRWIASHGLLFTIEFLIDAHTALVKTRVMFNGSDDNGTLDGTRANAFQHSYWVALMTRSVFNNDLFDREGMAWDYAEAHESEQRHGSLQDQWRSRMDRHNNRVGFVFAKESESHRKSNYRLCQGMRRANIGGHFGELGAGPRQVYWIFRLDGDGNRILPPGPC